MDNSAKRLAWHWRCACGFGGSICKRPVLYTMRNAGLPAVKCGEDLLHLVFSAAHDERLAVEHPAGAKAAERAPALVAGDFFNLVAEEVGFGEL